MKFLKSFIFLTILLLFSSSLSAESPISVINWDVSTDFMFNNAEWSISFPSGSTTDGVQIDTVSHLNYQDLHNQTISFHLYLLLFHNILTEISFRPYWFSFSQGSGSCIDTDKLTALGYQPFVFSESQCDAKAESIHFHIDFKTEISKTSAFDGVFTFYGLLGYIRDLDQITMTGGVQRISDNSLFEEDRIPPVGTRFQGLNSTYNFSWHTIKFGFTGEFEVFEIVHIQMPLALLYSFFYGEGYWNLRTYSATGDPEAWRDLDPNFIHYAANGIGILWGLKLAFEISPVMKLKIGYEFSHQHASDGKEELYFYNSALNSQADIVTFDYANYIRNIISLSLSYKI